MSALPQTGVRAIIFDLGNVLIDFDHAIAARRIMHFTDKTLGLIKRGPTVVEAVHVGEPSLDDPKRTLAPDVTKENIALFQSVINAGKPAVPAVVTPTGPNEPPRSDQPSQAPLQMAPPEGGTGVGVSIVSAPATDPNAVIKPVGPANSVSLRPKSPSKLPCRSMKSSLVQRLQRRTWQPAKRRRPPRQI